MVVWWELLPSAGDGDSEAVVWVSLLLLRFMDADSGDMEGNECTVALSVSQLPLLTCRGRRLDTEEEPPWCSESEWLGNMSMGGGGGSAAVPLACNRIRSLLLMV